MGNVLSLVKKKRDMACRFLRKAVNRLLINSLRKFPIYSTLNAVMVTQELRQKRLHLGHIAFMRAVVQGLDTRESWDRYLRLEGEHDDVRHVRKVIHWIRDEFAAAARRYERHGVARLVQIDVNRVADKEKKRPTLEEFSLDKGLFDFSQAEQLEIYQQHYKEFSSRQSRRSRLIAKQLEALHWLENLVVQPPRADDPIESWINPDLVFYLKEANIHTIRQVVERINGIGLRWWSSIRAIGPAKAVRIVDWLRMHEGTIGLPIGAHVDIKRAEVELHVLEQVVPQATAIVPLQKLILPQALNGNRGINRAPRESCLIDADTDLEASLIWLRTKGAESSQEPVADGRTDPSFRKPLSELLENPSHTQRAYLKELERLILWSVVQKQKAISSLLPEDCHAYAAFLANPLPSGLWCGPRGREKWSPLWRPFEGPLSIPAQRHAITIIKNLYKFLHEQRYLGVNPWAGVALPKKTVDKDTRADRAFNATQWNFVRERLTALPETSATLRLRFAIHLFYAAKLRLSEGIGARVDDIEPVDSAVPGKKAYLLNILENGKAARQVALDESLLQQLSVYFSARGLHPDVFSDENKGAYLLGKVVDTVQRAPWSQRSKMEIDPREGIAAGTLYDQLKSFFRECAAILAKSDAPSAKKLAAASTHWLRRAQQSDEVRA